MTRNDEKSWRWYVVVIGAAIVAMLVLGVGIWRLVRGDGSLLRDAVFSAAQITPNADGDTDLVRIQYDLSRNALVSIYFEDEGGQRFYFRNQRPRGAGEYELLFSGVVDGYTLPDDQIGGEILARLIPNGRYTWTIEAIDLAGVTERQSGELVVAERDPELPELRDFSLDKQLFTPNRDGINDRILIQYFLTKEASVRVFLQLPDGGELPIGELERDIPTGQPGRHYYDYEGGVDNGETPPPDGTYDVVAIAEDAEGQKVRVTSTLTIADGGVPRADIFAPPAGDTFEVSGTAVALCDTMFFTVTVQNYGNTILRTTGPEPGVIYDSDWNYNTLGWHTESGAWRVAIGYENELANYPYRWAVGSREDLIERDGFLYLPPGERAVVTGGIRLTGPFGERNPQPVWVGLIHEDVEITEFNNRVDPKQILVDLPNEENRPDCEPREIPVKVVEE